MAQTHTKADNAAFPFPAVMTNEKTDVQAWPGEDGMNMLEWYAGQALAGLVQVAHKDGLSTTEVASDAFNIAEAMVAEAQRRAEKRKE